MEENQTFLHARTKVTTNSLVAEKIKQSEIY